MRKSSHTSRTAATLAFIAARPLQARVRDAGYPCRILANGLLRIAETTARRHFCLLEIPATDAAVTAWLAGELQGTPVR